jgi:cold-inducible RNA-binding protein
MNLYVGNLDYSTRDEDLRVAFEEIGEVSSAKIISDRDTGRSKGFGFVEMPNDDEAQEAIKSLNGSTLKSREITVNEARPKPEGGGGGGGFRNKRY